MDATRHEDPTHHDDPTGPPPFQAVVARTDRNDLDEAIADLVEQVGDGPVQSITFFACPSYDFQALASRIHETFGVPSIGCTTAGELCASAGHCEDGVVLTAIRSPRFRMENVLIEDLGGFDAKRAQRDVDALRERCGGASFGMILVDGLAMAEEQVAAVLSIAFADVPFVGGSAGDNFAFKETLVAANGRAARNAVAIGLVHTDLPFRTFHTHHFEPTSERVVITGAVPSERRVTEINGLPASTGYAQAIGVPESDLSPSIFAEHPLLLRIGGEDYVRAIQQFNEDGSLSFYCAIDQGLVMRVGSTLDLVERLDQEFERLESDLGTVGLVFGFDCILRRLEVLNHDRREDVRRVMGRTAFAGFSTYGEQIDGLHVSQTLTGVAIGVAA